MYKRQTARPAESQLFTQQTAGEIATDFFNNSEATSPVTSSAALTGSTNTESGQSVIYVVNQVGVDNLGAAREPASQPIAYHIVTANQLPNCNQSQDISIVQYAASQPIQPAAGSDVNSPTSSGFRVLSADTMPSPSTDPSSGGIQFQLTQPMSFASKPRRHYHCCCILHTWHMVILVMQSVLLFISVVTVMFVISPILVVCYVQSFLTSQSALSIHRC